jgi:hypothetical protein
MGTRTKSCGVNVKNGKIAIFHGQESSIVIDPEDTGSVTLAEEMVWRIRNEAFECGQNYAKKQIKELLGIAV